MQKFPLRNRRPAVGPSTDGMPNECRGVSAVTRRPAAAAKEPSVRICNRMAGHNEDSMTWDAVFAGASKSKSWQSQASSSQVDSCGTAAAAVTTQGPVQQQQQQQTSARILQVPCIAATTRTTTTTTTTASINTSNNNHNRNKDDDDDDDENNRRRCNSSPRTLETETRPEPGGGSEAVAKAMPAGAITARELMTFEQLRLGDQINFLLFDPYRTLKFLITELKSRLRVVAPDDINAHKILVEIQQAVKRIRGSNATKPTARTTAAGTQGVAASTPLPVGCIPPHGRCHVIKEDPLINHARKVNSSCQTMESQLENVNACQMCERQVGLAQRCTAAAGCNQERAYGSNDGIGAKPHKRSGDRQRGGEMEERFNYKSPRSNAIVEDAGRIIAQLEGELLDIQTQGEELISRPLPSWKTERTPPPPPQPLPCTGGENSKVQCKRRPNEDAEQGNERQHQDVEDERQRAGTFSNFNARLVHAPRSKRDSCIQAAAETTSKEAQANVKNPTQLLCHLEKEKLLLLQQFRTAEMQSIQADLSELHSLIKDQLNGICRSIAPQHQSGREPFGSKKTRQRTTSGATPNTAQPSSSTPSLTAQTSSALSSSELPLDPPATTPESSTPPVSPVNGTANITKSMMRQKHLSLERGEELSSSSLSTRMNAEDSHRISDVDKANKTTDEKKSQLRQHRHSGRAKCGDVDTPRCRSRKRIHYSAVECGVRLTAKPARTSIHRDAKSTTKTSLATRQPMTAVVVAASPRSAQERTQLIASRAQPAPVPPPCGAGPGLDGMTNAAVKTIIPKPISADRSNGIRGHGQPLPRRTQNSWQCVNPSNPARCQLKKQICGNVHQPRVNRNNNSRTSTVDDNHSNYPQIHGCQKCRANAATVDRVCGLWPAPTLGAGMDNSNPAAASAPAPRARSFVPSSDDGGVKGGVADDVRRAIGVDGPVYSTCTSGAGDFILQPGCLHSDPVTKAFQMDFEEFKEFLDEIILSTPRLM